MNTRKLALLGALLAVAVNGCSKTQDTAPETRLFGQPPVISNVQFSSNNDNLACDLGPFILGFMCLLDPSVPPNGWTFQGTPVLNIGYTNIHVEVTASDPDSTSTANDVLLVGASYVHTGKETTLLVFDDGNQFQFPKGQTSQWDDGCTSSTNPPDANFCSPCPRGAYVLNSNDTNAGDGIYTRGYAFYQVGGTQRGFVAEDCIADKLHRAPVSASGLTGKTINFKIEAVDRSGNITTWPTEYPATIGSLTGGCVGDPCACCILLSDDPLTECRDLPGTDNPGYPGGFCHNLPTP